MKTWPLSAKILWCVMMVMDLTALLLLFVLHISVYLVVSVTFLSLVLMAVILVLRDKHHVRQETSRKIIS